MQKRQQRRVFEAAFKVEAVRRLHERLANNIPLSVIARELAVRPQQLRGWEKQLASPVGQAVHDVFPGGAPAQRGGGGAPPATRISPRHVNIHAPAIPIGKNRPNALRRLAEVKF